MFFTTLLLLFTQNAEAKFSIVCGEERARGPEHADVAVLENDNFMIEIWADGKLQPENASGLGDGPNGEIEANIDLGETEGKRKFIFNEKARNVQEFFIDAHDKQKKVGKPKRCTFDMDS